MLNFVVNSFTATTDDVAEFGNLAQEELIDIQVYTPEKRHIWKFGYVDFWTTQGSGTDTNSVRVSNYRQFCHFQLQSKSD